MLLTALTPAQSLEKTYRLQPGSRDQIDRFRAGYTKLLGRINEKESEENVKGHLMDFLKEVYYNGAAPGDAYLVAPKGKTDFVIHAGNDATAPAAVLFEVKRPINRGEMITRQNLNAKAFHELLLYYFRERIDAHNNDIRYCVVTNVYEWFVFDAADIDRLFFRNAYLLNEYKAWATKQKVSANNDLFYNEIAKPFLAALHRDGGPRDGGPEELRFTYFDLRDYQGIVAGDATANDPDGGPKALLALYKVLSPTHLLKLPTATDSNRLNPRFYSELLHLIGLEEVKEGNKKVIRRKETSRRDEGSLLENALIELDSSGKFYQLHDRAQYGASTDEQLFSVALELCITWVNRILFLKLLESQLVNYHRATNGRATDGRAANGVGSKEYAFLNRETIPDFDELNKLFFRVLARKPAERQPSIQAKFGRVPYLNSSLFELTDLENETIGINQLDNSLTLPLLRNSVLNENPAYRNTNQLPTLSYLFAFLDVYDFTSESTGAAFGAVIQAKNRPLINASVLGLIFEKINGYKDGSFYTPGFITEYMCRETIRKAVVQKFNDANGWACADFAELQDKDLDRAAANALINEIRICDPAVGSGHFLVSALNELIAVKGDLGILQDVTGKRLKDYAVSVLNDELLVQDEDEEPFRYGLGATGKPTAERQRVQKTLFHEKQTIIENCLFGVDINPNSVKICRLRLWIELLKNAYYTDESGFTELETLPNIDINIKQGNSLLSKFSLTEDLGDVFRKQKFSLPMYKDAVRAYKEAKSKDAKAELLRFINEIKSQFRETVSNRDPKRKKLAQLRGQRALLDNNIDVFGNPIKDPKLVAAEISRTDKYIEQTEREIADAENNALYRGSFEWRFEFPEVLDDKGDFVGFDAVIGNPPYGVKFNDVVKKYLALNFQATNDIYTLFIERAFQALRQRGLAAYIIPTTWQTGDNYLATRTYLVKFGQLIKGIILPYDVFNEAYVDTGIYLFKKVVDGSYSSSVYEFDPKKKITGRFADFIHFQSLKSDDWVNQQGLKIRFNQGLSAINSKFTIDTVPLQDIAKSARGVLGSESDVATSKLDSTYKPFFNGKSNRFFAEKPYLFIKYGDNLKEKPQSYDFFKGDRILVRRIVSRQFRIMATLTNEEFVSKKDLYIFKITDSHFTIEYILALLNSTLFSFLKTKGSTAAKKDDFTQLTLSDIRELPIRRLDGSQQDVFKNKVNQILTAKAADPTADTSTLEAEIDRLIYVLYGLTEEEIALVEGRNGIPT